MRIRPALACHLALAAALALVGCTTKNSSNALSVEPPSSQAGASPPEERPLTVTGRATRAADPGIWQSTLGLPLVSADGRRLGKVVGVEGDGREPVQLVAELGGFLSFSSATVRIPADSVILVGEDVQVALSAERIKELAGEQSATAGAPAAKAQ